MYRLLCCVLRIYIRGISASFNPPDQWTAASPRCCKRTYAYAPLPSTLTELPLTVDVIADRSAPISALLFTVLRLYLFFFFSSSMLVCCRRLRYRWDLSTSYWQFEIVPVGCICNFFLKFKFKFHQPEAVSLLR